MTTIHVLVYENQTNLYEVTKRDAQQVDTLNVYNQVNLSGSYVEQLKVLSQIEYQPGDVICFAGACVRQFTQHISDIAKNSKLNYMPGHGVDHRGQPIPFAKISRRIPIDKNFYEVWPSLMVIGNPESARTSFETLAQLDSSICWPHYEPENPTLEHYLSILPYAFDSWFAPHWFKIVDMSVRDLEVVPVMYATHRWHDWISFYPANKNFKLENHTQLYPVWLAGSSKPLEYWQGE